MIFKQIFTTYLPCNKKFELPLSLTDIDTSKMIKRKESNGTVTLFDPSNKAVYFEREDSEVFPLDTPVQVDLEITQRCNLRCKHCFVDSRDAIFSNKTFETIKKLADSGVVAFELIGGEPFLVSEIFDVIRYLKDRNKIVTISTNGTLITREIVEKLAQNPPTKIFVSLDGSKEINDLIRGRGSFDKAIEGIKNLNKFEIIPAISFCINKLNIDSIPDLLQELRELKIKSIFFIFGEPPTKNNSFSKYFFSHSEREEIARRISGFNLGLKYTMHFEPKKINALYFGCFFRLTMCEITPSGDVLSCPIIRKKEGNVLEEDLKVIWKRMQDRFLKERSKKCKECKWNYRCYPCEFDKKY